MMDPLMSIFNNSFWRRRHNQTEIQQSNVYIEEWDGILIIPAYH